MDVFVLDKVDLTCILDEYAHTATDVLDLLDKIIDATCVPLEAALHQAEVKFSDPEAEPEVELHELASTQIKPSPEGETQILVAPPILSWNCCNWANVAFVRCKARLPRDSAKTAQTLPLTSRLEADVALDEAGGGRVKHHSHSKFDGSAHVNHVKTFRRRAATSESCCWQAFSLEPYSDVL